MFLVMHPRVNAFVTITRNLICQATLACCLVFWMLVVAAVFTAF